MASRTAPSQLPTLDDADLAVALADDLGLRHIARGRRKFALQPVEHHLVLDGILRVGPVLVVSRAAREVRPLGTDAGQGAVRDRVIVAIHVAVELVEARDLLRRQHLAAVGSVRIVPLQVLAHPIVHADVEIGEDEHRRLQALGQVERLDRHVKAFFGIGRKQQHVTRVAVRGIGAEHDVALLGAGGHAGRRADPLHIEYHAGNLGVIGEAQKFVHERDAGSARGRERACAVPARAEHHADGGQLVLGLDYRIVVLAGGGIDPIAVAEPLEGVHERGRGRDGVPGADGGARIDAAQARGRVAVDHDVAARLVHALDPQRQRTLQMRLGIVVAETQRPGVRLEELRLLAVALGHQAVDRLEVDIQQRRHHARIGDVLEQDAVAHPIEVLVHELRERHADDGDVAALQERAARPRCVIERDSRRRRLRARPSNTSPRSSPP